MPKTQPEIELLFPMSAGEPAAACFGTLARVAAGRPWGWDGRVGLAGAGRRIVGGPLGR